ncbi:M23 family metallopeptidase [Nesterenkonia sp. NBAIMH1]|uniref:M23 family metallopeptidase n=1 Tax=Nesterenkonia sp. NBAIMH1 TaxID=2600320 RepID=UPI0011B4BB43|nr:M23 family metallopeptidase [Nesterenkonia sp. NBAIMH1]
MPSKTTARPLAGAMLCLMMLALPLTTASAADHPDDWRSPSAGASVVRAFAAPPAPWASGHRGVKLGASPSSAVRAPERGTVLFSGKVVNRYVLTIAHGAGYVSSFEPVETELEVGDTVTQGQQIASLATYDDGTYACEAACLHWGVRHHGEYINPMLLLGPVEPSVLLPLDERSDA